ncbi:MAG: TrmH family RNA methyltransferase [Pirellulaceae bacterium]|jgi:tRNA G18 (ribose-2'-O)-methylase SpoU|nr:TrmH family RNA methyltransferase [Pirellulaceae bacterium]
MGEFVHERHRPPVALPDACELVIACPPLRSNVNLSRIVRVASSCGVRRMIACGHATVDRKIARDGADQVAIERHRSLAPVLTRLRAAGFQLVGLEQTNRSRCVYQFPFRPRTVLVVGHERAGLEPAVLERLDEVVEIPVFGLPYSYNVATATAMVLYEYCRQFAAPPRPGGTARS